MVSRHLIENGGPWGTGWGCFGRGLAPPFRLGFRSMEHGQKSLDTEVDISVYYLRIL